MAAWVVPGAWALAKACLISGWMEPRHGDGIGQDAGDVVAGGRVVAGGDRAPGFDPAEAAFHDVEPIIGFGVEVRRPFACPVACPVAGRGERRSFGNVGGVRDARRRDGSRRGSGVPAWQLRGSVAMSGVWGRMGTGGMLRGGRWDGCLARRVERAGRCRRLCRGCLGGWDQDGQVRQIGQGRVVEVAGGVGQRTTGCDGAGIVSGVGCRLGAEGEDVSLEMAARAQGQALCRRWGARWWGADGAAFRWSRGWDIREIAWS
mgnify:CR=1 FL=1